MSNNFMKEFEKRFIKGFLVGMAIILAVLFCQFFTDMNPLGNLKWYIVPVVLIICLLYGTGWYFAYNLIKRAWRKLLRVNRNASIWQAITGHGLWLGLLYSMLCFIGGCILAMFVGNYFMIKDYCLAKKGLPPVSLKYKFDSDIEYDNWISSVRNAVEYSDIANNADAKQRLENEINLQNIEKGDIGTVTTDIKNGDKERKKTTTIAQ